MAKSGETQRERIINRINDIKRKLEVEDPILRHSEEELLERLVIAIRDFLELVS